MYTDQQLQNHIFDLQTFLRRIQRSQGHIQPLVPDGIFGAETAAAVRDFQRQNSLPVTGTADFDTGTRSTAPTSSCAREMRRRRPCPFSPQARTPRSVPGDKGASVFALQLLLGAGAATLPGHHPGSADRHL